MHYTHPQPHLAMASVEQKTAVSVFETWRNFINGGMLLNPTVVALLKAAATKQAEREEVAAQKASMSRWLEWMRGGPAGGLRRQHRFTRVPTGWTESAACSGRDVTVGDNDDLEGLSTDMGEEDNPDGLSEEQLRQLKMSAVSKGSPVDAQCEANDQADAWAVQWGAELTSIWGLAICIGDNGTQKQ